MDYAGDPHSQLIKCTHEEASAAIAYGYAKAAGKPMVCLVDSARACRMRQWRYT
ncbi:hypothetical protein [uncultured Caballeronia sp.]|uniref:hypothetical protein n=1 Tax=uncultured Caballeronia sp. TaxID=1827198 RepID=UPI0035CA5484